MKTTLLLSVAGLLLSQAHAQTTCITSLPITPGTYTVNFVSGSEVPLPICSQYGVGATMGAWYSYTPLMDTAVTISTVASGLDTRFHVYTGGCGALLCHAGDDDGGGNLTSLATFDVTAGTTYIIAFDNKWNSYTFDFTMEENVVITPPPPAEGTVAFTPQTFSGFQGYSYGAVDMNGDFLDDMVSVTGSNINILQQEVPGGMTPHNYPTGNVQFPATWSMAAGDLDGNGYNDLQYGNGSGVSFLMANSTGTDYVVQNFPQYVFSQRGNMIDINNDGNLDAFMCHDVSANVYYMNDGTGTLTFGQGQFGTSCGNYGSIWVDYDGDGDMDLFVAKCGCDPVDILMRNNGDGTFTSMAAALGFADSHQSWSSAWGDFDNDGDMDVLVGSSSSSYHKLMRNNGDGTFTNITAGSGFDSFGGQSIEWNTRDFNNDGYLDIIGGGAIHYNNGDLTFSPDNTAPQNGPIGDLNNDGFLDIVSGSTAMMNQGNDNHWLTVNLIGTVSNRNGIGARIQVTSELGSQIREIRSGDGFRYMSSLNAHFGFGTDSVITGVTVHWPSGIVDEFSSAEVDQAMTITEGMTLTTGIADAAAEHAFGLFPNPVKDVLTVIGGDVALNDPFEVLDVTGKRVLQGTLTRGHVDVSSLNTGVYVLSVRSGTAMSRQQFVKE
ncbi:MAG: VCBS repeat-containing protein [Flavobacteriales bacterium]|nr:VCBS repeat-containing protein [Flavobacteriales bacterium]